MSYWLQVAASLAGFGAVGLALNHLLNRDRGGHR